MNKEKQPKTKKQKAKVVPERSERMKSVQVKSILAGAIAAAIVVFLAFYFLLVPINIHAIGMWVLAAFATAVFAVVKSIAFSVGCMKQTSFDESERHLWGAYRMGQSSANGKMFLIPVVILAAMIIIAISGAKIFHASSYASLIRVEDAVFEEDLAETLNTDSIALMDTQSAQMLGDREIGSLSNVVSQYDVADDYTQIDYNGTPKKVAALRYAGFFKWKNNHREGIPGYVVVDPVSMSASYQECEEGMIYVPSAYLREDAARYIWKHFKTEIFGNLHFEIDESGKPFYVASVYEKTISLFGGETVKGAIVLNPVNGDIQYYALEDIPKWVDVAYSGDLICTQYNWYGELQNGFINSVFGKKGCKRVTTYTASEEEDEDATPVSDYGYVAKDGDIWIYTGITSVNGDSSNIGFLLANERTGEAHYYNIAGADEKSAMAAAEGEVQEKRYQASFPSLINVDGEPTYIMVLKDASGLVKLYAAVNVEQYNLVATASTQKECIEKYRTFIGTSELPAAENGEEQQQDVQEEKPEPTGEADVEIADIKYIDINGNTYIYLITRDSSLYRAKASEHEEMLLLKNGDRVHLSFHEKDILTCEKLSQTEMK